MIDLADQRKLKRASMCIKLTRNKMIVLMVTQILKATGSSENRSAK